MAITNRQGATPGRGGREGVAVNQPNAGTMGPVSTRRNVEDFDDPYIPEESYSGTAICRECHAVFQEDRWSLDERIYEDALLADNLNYVVCPACQKIQDKQPGGIVTLTGDFIPPHREEILNLIRNEDARARNVNPLERVMEIREDGKEMVVTTTNEKLAQRIGRAMRRAYKGDVEYQWLGESKQARVFWSR